MRRPRRCSPSAAFAYPGAADRLRPRRRSRLSCYALRLALISAFGAAVERFVLLREAEAHQRRRAGIGVEGGERNCCDAVFDGVAGEGFVAHGDAGGGEIDADEVGAVRGQGDEPLPFERADQAVARALESRRASLRNRNAACPARRSTARCRLGGVVKVRNWCAFANASVSAGAPQAKPTFQPVSENILPAEPIFSVRSRSTLKHRDMRARRRTSRAPRLRR